LRDWVEIAYCLHGLESFQVCLDLGPFCWVVFGGDGCLRVGVVVDEVVFELGGDGAIGMAGEHGEEPGVGLIGEGVTTGLYLEAGIEVAVGKIVLDGVEVVEHQAERSDGAVDALDVEIFGVLVGAANGEEFKCADLGEDEDEAGVEMAADAGWVTIFFPVVFGGCLSEVLHQKVEIRAGDVIREVLFVEDGLGAGDVGKETPGGEAIDTHGGSMGANDVGQIEAIGFEEGLAEKIAGDLEADVTEISRGSEAELAELIDVEGELGLDVGVGVFGVVDGGAVAPFEPGELDGDGKVDGGAVADGVADVVREGADGEGELVGGLGVAEEREDEVSGADVVGEIGEEAVAEGVVAEVLDGAAAVGVTVRLLDLGVGEGGVLLEEDGADGLLPGEVDELFVGLDGVGDGWRGGEEQGQERYRLEESGASWSLNRVTPECGIVMSVPHFTDRKRFFGDEPGRRAPAPG
jgi:hypothetical protein